MKDLMWGFNNAETRALPEDTPRWGARAILDGGFLDLLPDRQSYSEQPFPDHIELTTILDRYMPEIRDVIQKLWDRGRLRQDSEEVFVLLDAEDFKVMGSAKGSYGYFYITAWISKDEDQPLRVLNHMEGAVAVLLQGTIEDWRRDLRAASR